jgi:AcrR family transcriptional regulator
MPPRRLLPKEERIDAVRRAFSGEGVEAVAAELGVAITTLYRWAAEDPYDPDPEVPERKLVLACQDLLRERTLGSVSLVEVAERAGVSQRTAYNHYKDKLELFRAAVDDAGNTMSTAMARRMPQAYKTLSPRKQLRELVLAGFDASFEARAGYLVFSVYELPAGDRTVERWHEGLRSGMVSILRQDHAVKLLRPPFDPESAAEVAMTAARYFLVAAHAGGDRHALRLASSRIPALVMRGT